MMFIKGRGQITVSRLFLDCYITDVQYYVLHFNQYLHSDSSTVCVYSTCCTVTVALCVFTVHVVQ